MSEDKKSLINLVPNSVDDAAKNIVDKPTQNIGTTLADIWYLVFGGISQAADKKKLKYSCALQEFEKVLKEKLDKIPEEKKVEPDIQIVAPALEDAKYCIDKESLRKLFSNLISKSMNSDYSKYVHPIFCKIISHITPLDSNLLKSIYTHQINSTIVIEVDNDKLILSLSALENQGLIQTNIEQEKNIMRKIIAGEQSYERMPTITEVKSKNKTIIVSLTELGKAFCDICVNSDV